MKAAGKYLFLLGLIASSSAASAAKYADDIAAIYRAPNLDGLTGLLNMNLPYTMGAGMTLGIGGIHQDDLIYVYKSFTTLVGTLRVGFGDNVEVGLKGKSHTLEPLVGENETGTGDSEVMIKWKFRDQNENLPAMALGLGGILPTGDKDKGFTEVENWGGKVSVTAAAEMPLFENSYLGLYGELQWYMMDKAGGVTPYSDVFTVTNLGIAFPISEDNHFVLFVEYNKTDDIDVKDATLVPYGGLVRHNHSVMMPGLRWAYENFSLTIAGQNVTYEGVDEPQQRWLGNLTVGF